MKRRLGLLALACWGIHPVSATELKIYLKPGSLEARINVRINGKLLEFIVDTGASQSSLSEESYNQLGLAQEEPQYARARVADGRIVTSKVARFQNIEVGNFQVAYLNTSVGSFNLLGMDILGRYRLILDPQNNLLTMQDPTDEDLRLNGNEASFPFNPRQFRIPVQVTINDTPVMLLLDTGATSTILSQRIANALNLPVVGSTKNTVADGRVVTSKLVSMTSITLGNYTLNNLTAAVIEGAIGERGGDGLLGYNFLRNFRLILDPTTRRGYLQR